MKPRIYLDTSVISALHDDRTPDRQLLTREFWGRLPEFEVSTSSVTRSEVDGTQNAAQRSRLAQSLAEIRMFELTDEMISLASRYMASGVFSLSMKEDARHVAAAVLTRHEILASWNFKHLVNRRRRSAVNALNIAAGLPTIDIISPPEV